ncbi:MAG: hypothetical protein U0230_22755 [Polyangiales bacterium]
MSIACAIFVGACGPAPEAPRRGPRAAATSARAPARPSSAPAPRGACRAGEPRRLADAVSLPRAVAVATRPDGSGLVAFGADDAHLATVAFPANGGEAAAPLSVPFPLADRLLSITTVGDAGFVAVAHGPCPAGATTPLCLSALALDATGEPVGEPLVLPVRARMERLRRHASEASLFLACSVLEGPPWLEVLTRSREGLSHARVELGHRFDPGERQADVLYVTTYGESWAVLYRIGAIEDPEGEVVLATERGERALPALHDAAMIETAVFEREAFATVATFEFGRPLAFRFDRLGRLVAAPAELGRGEAPPPPFLARLAATLEDDGRSLSLRPRTAIGDDVGEPLPLASRALPSPSAASVARTPTGFVVAYAAAAERGATAMLRAVECEAPR